MSLAVPQGENWHKCLYAKKVLLCFCLYLRIFIEKKFPISPVLGMVASFYFT